MAVAVAVAVAVALALALALASEIGPGFSPDITNSHNPGFSPWDFLFVATNPILKGTGFSPYVNVNHAPPTTQPAKLKGRAGRWAGQLFVALKDGSFVDNATKRQLKKNDTFIALTESGTHWAEENRQQAILYGVIAVVAIIVIVGIYTFYQSRSASADTAFGQAMEIYQTPLATSTTELAPGTKTFPDAKSRAAAANSQFQQVASKYGFTTPGHLTEYFVGLTYEDEAQYGPAQQALQKVASSWNGSLAALGKDALAALDQQTNQDAQAIDLYNELSKGKSSTVPADLAQLQLAELYQAQGKTDQSRQILALLKDKDKDSKGSPGAAAEIATQKLNPTPAAGAPSLQ